MTNSALEVFNGGLSPVTKRWLDEVVIRAQDLAAELVMADRDEAERLLREFSQTIPRPVNAIDRIVLRSVLLDVAFKAGRTTHARLHAGLDVPCAFVPTTLLDRFWSASTEDVREQFEHWRVALLSELNRTHPASLGSSIGRLVKRDVRKPWSLRDLARRFHVTPSRIRRAFQHDFGVSVAEYQRLARLSAALDPLRRDKLEAVALSVGFRSAKNFYRAFARLIGLTPRAFRTMPPDQAADVMTKARRRLLRIR